MMSPVVIGRATAGELKQLLPLLEELFSLEEDFSFNKAKARTALTSLLHDTARSCVLVARLQGRIVGMCSAQLVMSTSQGALSAWVEDVIVEHSSRGRGIGQTLLNELEQWCQEQGVTRMQLLADKDNLPALDFYHRTEWQDTNLKVMKKLI